MTIFLRADRALFRFSGPDAHRLLNDVVTGRIPTAGDGAAWWALLTPQGKIVAEGLCGWAEDALWLDVHLSVAESFFKKMKMYRLRAKVEIEDLSLSHRVGWSAEPAPGAISHRDRNGEADIGWRIIAPAGAAGDWVDDPKAYIAARVAAGRAELGPDFAPETTFAHDIGMDILEGIDFAKGCYVGQEVVSRMKHRGTARRRPVLVAGLKDTDAGQPILVGEREAGTVGAVADGRAVGVVRLDRLPDGTAGSVNGRKVTITLPAWARYGFGESPAQD